MIKIKKPLEFNNKEIEKFYQLVLKGGEDNPIGLNDRIKNAELLGFYYIGDEIAGIAALKNPNPNYKIRIFKDAGLSKDSEKYIFELGYAYTLKKFRKRGVCSSLIKELIEKAPSKKIFATTKVSNPNMNKINLRMGLKKSGRPFIGMEEEIQLYLY